MFVFTRLNAAFCMKCHTPSKTQTDGHEESNLVHFYPLNVTSGGNNVNDFVIFDLPLFLFASAFFQ